MRAVTDRAQTEVTSEVLLVALAVVAVGLAAPAIFATVDSPDRTRATVDPLVCTDGIELTHAGGEGVAAADLVVVLRVDGSESRTTLAAAGSVSGDGDGRFEPGERWRYELDLDPDGDGSPVAAAVVAPDTNEVLASVERAPCGGLPPSV